MPLYWKQFGNASPLEIVSHRVIWSLVLLAMFIVMFRQVDEMRAVLRDGRRLATLVLTASLLGANWALFIYGVVSDQVVQTSLGYFLNPLVSILLGFVFLKERLSRMQTGAVFLAVCGVAHFGFHVGHLPWLALSLALTFGLYGLLRKIVTVTPLVGVTVETSLIAPVALGIIWALSSQGHAEFGEFAATQPSLCGGRCGDHASPFVVQQRGQTTATRDDGISPVSGTDAATARRNDRFQGTLLRPGSHVLHPDLDSDCPLRILAP